MLVRHVMYLELSETHCKVAHGKNKHIVKGKPIRFGKEKTMRP
jgi:hypothetical protein